MPRFAPEKSISIPPYGRVDISGYLPIIQSEEFQRLRYKRQLSLVGDIFPGAIHTRFLHTLGVFQETRLTLREMFSRGFFLGEDREEIERKLAVAALVHDIGHPAYSHMVEYVLMDLAAEGEALNHNQVGNEIILNNLAARIKECGCDPYEIVQLLDKSKPSIGGIITAKSVGADKRLYLVQDQHMAGFNEGGSSDVIALRQYLGFNKEGRIVVEEKAERLLEGLQNFYFNMYTLVYLRKQCLSSGRVLQKSLEHHLQDNHIDPRVIWDKPEGWLNTKLAESSSKTARRLFGRIYTGDKLKAAVTLKIDDCLDQERVAGKNIKVLCLSEEEALAVNERYRRPTALTELEAKLANYLDIEEYDLVVTTVPDPDKIVPEDVWVVDIEGNNRRTLFERIPDFQVRLQEKARKFYALRIMVDDKYREMASRKAEDLRDIILSGL